MENSVSKNQSIIKFSHNKFESINDKVATEVPLTIQLNGKEFATMLCTPSHIQELVLGFLASEGIIRTYTEIKSLLVDEEKGFAYVEINKSLKYDPSHTSKRVIGSCCGKSRQFYFQSDVNTAKTVGNSTTLTVKQCISLMGKLQENSADFLETGGIHNAALCTKDDLVVIFSDIGRHNAIDKIYGFCLLEKISLRDKVIVFSGRISSEVLLKVSKLGAGILLSKSAPTTLAIELAEDLGITAVGFIRGGRLSIYSHPERIKLD